MHHAALVDWQAVQNAALQTIGKQLDAEEAETPPAALVRRFLAQQTDSDAWTIDIATGRDNLQQLRELIRGFGFEGNELDVGRLALGPALQSMHDILSTFDEEEKLRDLVADDCDGFHEDFEHLFAQQLEAVQAPSYVRDLLRSLIRRMYFEATAVKPGMVSRLLEARVKSLIDVAHKAFGDDRTSAQIRFEAAGCTLNINPRRVDRWHTEQLRALATLLDELPSDKHTADSFLRLYLQRNDPAGPIVLDRSIVHASSLLRDFCRLSWICQQLPTVFAANGVNDLPPVEPEYFPKARAATSDAFHAPVEPVEPVEPIEDDDYMPAEDDHVAASEEEQEAEAPAPIDYGAATGSEQEAVIIDDDDETVDAEHDEVDFTRTQRPNMPPTSEYDDGWSSASNSPAAPSARSKRAHKPPTRFHEEYPGPIIEAKEKALFGASSSTSFAHRAGHATPSAHAANVKEEEPVALPRQSEDKPTTLERRRRVLEQPCVTPSSSRSKRPRRGPSRFREEFPDPAIVSGRVLEIDLTSDTASSHGSFENDTALLGSAEPYHPAQRRAAVMSTVEQSLVKKHVRQQEERYEEATTEVSS